jgi:hypothetical protein
MIIAGPRPRFFPPAPRPVDPISQEVRTGLVPALRAAQARLIRRDPGARGKLALRWTVQPTGQATSVTVVEDTIPSREFKTSVVGLVLRWRFPVLPEAREVSYPFVFV